jgi:DNA mismatch endonuclease (patch repair protein)
VQVRKVVDIVDKATRSRMMAGIRGINTKPEIIVRKFLHRHGFRYRLHADSLPGRPDLVLPKYKLAIFIHGCFWHQHAGCRFATVPAQNREKWATKFQQNRERDSCNINLLLAGNWRVFVIWECFTRRSGENCRLLELLPKITERDLSFVEFP